MLVSFIQVRGTIGTKKIMFRKKLFSLILFRDQYSEHQLPTHPCLELVANSEQVLSIYTSRRLLTYKKIQDPKVCSGK